jgi:hypothetical protein
MTQHKGLILHVYRAADSRDCTLGGVSSKHAGLTLVGFKRHADEKWQPLERYAQVFEPNEDRPAVILVESGVPHLYGPHLVPLEIIESGRYPMMGGNYAGTSDSRWAELGHTIFGHDRLDVVAVHDRVEF